jgi:hypothetical protein
MTSQQVDNIQNVMAACDEFIHAFIQDYPSKSHEVEAFAEALATWAKGNPVAE